MIQVGFHYTDIRRLLGEKQSCCVTSREAVVLTLSSFSLIQGKNANVGHKIQYVEIKCQLDATDDFYCRSYCLLNMFRASLCPSSGAPHHTDNLKTKIPNTTGSNHSYNTLQLLMMDIVMPETC